MARRMNAENLNIYRAVAVIQWLNENGEVTNETSAVYGPYSSGSNTGSAAHAAEHDPYIHSRYYKKPDGKPDYSRPKKRVKVETQRLDTVVTLKSYADGRPAEYGSELVWVNA